MASPFLPAFDLLAQYAEYHRDRRNIVTHFIGVPMIVFAVGVLLARPALAGRPGAVAGVGGVRARRRLVPDARRIALGVAVSLAGAVLIALAHPVAEGGTGAWLAWGVGFFVVGWVIQFVGHYYEGRKPAFADDLVGLLVGPMFVTAEALFALGMARPLLDEVERRAGPTVLRDLAHLVG